MKRLTIFRHAKSSWSDDALSDHERPLSERGRRDAPAMGLRLAQHGLRPDLILSSTAVRARQTAASLADTLAYPTTEIRHDAALYLASPGDLLRVLANLNDGIGDVILVGHNPGMTALVNMMLPTIALGNLPTAGAVAVDAEVAGWRGIDTGPFRLRFYDYPRKSD
jgi:phosphohistidine phosphatase